MNRAPLIPQPDLTLVDDLSPENEYPAYIGEEEGGSQPSGHPAKHSGIKAAGLTPLVAAERAVIGSMLVDPYYVDIATGYLSAQDFSVHAYGVVFAEITAIRDGEVEGVKVADTVTVSLLPRVQRLLRLEELEELALGACLDEALLVGYLTLIRDHAAERKLGAAVLQAADLMQGSAGVHEKSQAIKDLIAKTAPDRSVPVISLGEAAIGKLTDMALAAREGRPRTGIPTGYEDLDLMTAGLHGGQLIVLGARPGMGKTALAFCMGMHAASQGHATLMASLEMKAAELSMRAVSMVSGVEGHLLRTQALNTEQWDAVVAAGEHLSTLPLNIADIPGMNLASLTAVARKMHREGKLKFLIVDYLQIMTPGNKSGNREQQIAEISRGLKVLAMDLGIPILVLSQLNRSVETRVDRRPMLSDLRESGSLEQDADVVMFVHREDMVKKIGGGTGVAELILAKQRSGSTGDLCLGFDDATTRFYDPRNPNFLLAPTAIKAVSESAGARSRARRTHS